jgi:TrmH family RNA methyltransferase
MEAVEAGWPVATLVFQTDVAGRPKVAEAIRATRAAGGLCLEVSRDVLAKTTKRDNPQTVVGVLPQRWHALADVRPGRLWIALETVRDPGNLGTILRTADAVAADGVILIGETCDPYSPESVRASMGSIVRVPLVRCTAEAFRAWRAGWPGLVVGTDLSGDADYRKLAYDPPVLLVMGNEQAGLTDAMAAACDRLVKIPMAGGADSLNLSVATAVMLFEIARERLTL